MNIFLLGIIIIIGYRNRDILKELFVYTVGSYYDYNNDYKKIIPYTYRNNNYKLLVKRDIEPNLLFAKNERGEDITNELSDFAGPNQNFTFPITPVDLGYDKITIITLNEDTERVFHHDEIITIN